MGNTNAHFSINFVCEIYRDEAYYNYLSELVEELIAIICTNKVQKNRFEGKHYFFGLMATR